ncbi:VOC family protein [Histidinibacterium lentulum]|uniref:VOC family protein n=1 Tax=Histidinibacterium lentulum TaxID=2480588 RepID=A0A3N2R6U3_9RHOB|nr:VOC family protein [Histidinibacterium lentulum]ROU03199.1 VOC family protein [Histidinibacterium lentulum]
MDLALSHVGIAVPDLEAAIARFTERLGVPPGPVLVNDIQRVRLVQFDLGNARIELLSPLSDDSPVAAFLARNPRGGLHHLALATGDLDAELDSCRDAGVRVLAPPSLNVFGKRIAFLHPADMFGALVEMEGS